MERENNSNSRYVTDSMLSVYWERFALWGVTFLVSVCCWLFLDQKTKVEQLDVKIQALQVEKVSRQELKDLEDRLYNRMDGMKGDIILHINMLRDKK